MGLPHVTRNMTMPSMSQEEIKALKVSKECDLVLLYARGNEIIRCKWKLRISMTYLFVTSSLVGGSIT